MQVKDVMTRNPQTISSQATIAEAAKLMRDLDIGFLPAIEDDRPLGVVTDRDIVVRGTAEGKGPDCCVGDVLTPAVVTVTENEDVSSADRLMRERQIRRVLVVDDSGSPVGVVSLGDLAVEQTSEACDVLREVSVPNMPRH